MKWSPPKLGSNRVHSGDDGEQEREHDHGAFFFIGAGNGLYISFVGAGNGLYMEQAHTMKGS